MNLLIHFNLVNQTIDREIECPEYVPVICPDFEPKTLLRIKRRRCHYFPKIFQIFLKIWFNREETWTNRVLRSNGLWPTSTRNDKGVAGLGRERRGSWTWCTGTGEIDGSQFILKFPWRFITKDFDKMSQRRINFATQDDKNANVHQPGPEWSKSQSMPIPPGWRGSMRAKTSKD